MKTLSKYTVLIVDDAETNLDMLAEILRDEYHIMAARSGAEALKMTSQKLPDLILLDIMMPEMDGYEVIRKLKDDPATWDIPVIFVTAMAEVADETTGFELGAVDYITKPISSAIVKARVRSQLLLKQSQKKLADQNLLLEDKVRERTGRLVSTQAKLEKLVELGIALNAARDTDKILNAILKGGTELTRADVGTVYLRTSDDQLRFAVRTYTDELPVDRIPMYDPETGEPNHHNIATHVALSGETVNIPDAYNCDEFDFSGTKQFDRATGYHSKSFLTVPLKPRGGQVIGVLQLINAMDPETGVTIPFDPQLTGFVEALAAQSAVAIENQRLLEAQKEQFNAFIKLIASAIDAKSPYTGGHCMRVPEIAMMLAKAVSESRKPPFNDLTLDDEELNEMHLAAWLHDCGKVTTPEHIVDKATKLEAICNRIHEIRMRFEVLRRDAKIVSLKAILDGRAGPEEAERRFAETVALLEDDFQFLAQANVGGEFMAPEKQARIRTIAENTWQRYFDDRLGLSDAELKRKGAPSGEPLPVTEPLLADRPEHLIPRDDWDNADRLEKLGIRMDLPQYLYNLGEIYNLCIPRGTLTPEDRFKINDHVIQTISMLEKLPFAENTAGVPAIAGAHHEAMIGTGYPRKLTGEEMSIQARILVIADIFEALTASDRPYKKAKTLSEAIRIMGFMQKDQHIDADLFALFLKKGIFRQYAERFLRPEQIDDVDISAYV